MNDLRVGTVKDPEIVNPHDAILRVSLSDDLRLGPALHRRLHPHHEARRRDRPRVHGRDRGCRPRGEAGQEGRPRRRPSFIPAANAGTASTSFTRSATTPIPSPSCRSRCSAAIPRPASTAIPTPSAAMREPTPSMCACRPRTRTASRCRTGWRTRRRCSSRMPRRRATWAPISATSSRATRSRSGAAAAWADGAAERAADGRRAGDRIDRFPERCDGTRARGSETIDYTRSTASSTR